MQHACGPLGSLSVTAYLSGRRRGIRQNSLAKRHGVGILANSSHRKICCDGSLTPCRSQHCRLPVATRLGRPEELGSRLALVPVQEQGSRHTPCVVAGGRHSECACYFQSTDLFLDRYLHHASTGLNAFPRSIAGIERIGGTPPLVLKFRPLRGRSKTGERPFYLAVRESLTSIGLVSLRG